jgi:hypothetical protein
MAEKLRKTIKLYLQPAFLICVVVLVAAGSSMSMVIKGLGVYLKKEPLPLKKSLDLLDEAGLGPYTVVSKKKIDNEEVVKALGTRNYIEWVLCDTAAEAASPLRYCSLFITYYDLPDVVVHVPEECYIGSGYQRLMSESVSVRIERNGSEEQIPAKYLVFTGEDSGSWLLSTKFSVLYNFRVNGVYVNSREDARLTLNKNVFGKHSYFCKVEWKFFNLRYGTLNEGMGGHFYPTKEEAVEASRKLLTTILPILEEKHWPQMD